MEKRFIMTAFGTDRPGIVADVTEVIFETGCTLENTTMTRLADEFTLILLFTGQGDELEQTLHMACRRLEREKNIFSVPQGSSKKTTPDSADRDLAKGARRGTGPVRNRLQDQPFSGRSSGEYRKPCRLGPSFSRKRCRHLQHGNCRSGAG
ncbi:hypothetical protein B2D07_19980 [Desulfococcus multivorans]|nr:hypothetical protein B2D07_19980 [Desulfococcus multivorans]